ncbi:MAG: hypothetical protein QXX94_07275 [Candidatus Bathyarchaeia archaeon]
MKLVISILTTSAIKSLNFVATIKLTTYNNLRPAIKVSKMVEITFVILIATVLILSLLLAILYFSKPSIPLLEVTPKTVKEGETLTVSLKVEGLLIKRVSAWIIDPRGLKTSILLRREGRLYRGEWLASRPFEIHRVEVEVDGLFSRVSKSENIRVIENWNNQVIAVLLDINDQIDILRKGVNFFPVYIREVLRHAGFFYETIDKSSISSNLKCKILIIPYNTSFSAQEKMRIRDFISSGGVIIAIGGSSGLDDIFGVRGLGETIDEGYIVADGKHPIILNLTSSLHVFGSIPLYSIVDKNAEVIAKIKDSEGKLLDSPAIVLNRYFNGLAILIAPDILSSIVMIQQGKSVLSDGPWPVNDGILKTDDGAVLNYNTDRENVSGHEIFLQPIADEEREIIIKSILYAAWSKGIPLPVLWYWPREVMAVALYSHDSDGGDEYKANLLLSNLSALGVKSTWCILPGEGYSKEFYDKLKRGGYEIALHYNALPPKHVWSREGFVAQYDALAVESGVYPISNKNHYLRWESWTDFYHWCEDKGVYLDQSKGPSKTHNLGFLFGTSHPFFPIDDWSNMNRILNVLEVTLHDQEMWRGWPEDEVINILNSLTLQAYKHYGVIHHLFHPAHIQMTYRVLNATIQFIKSLPQMEIWTAREINEWERKRREVGLHIVSLSEDSLTFNIFSTNKVEDATIMLLIPENLEDAKWSIEADGERINYSFTRIYDFSFLKFTINIENSILVKVCFNR